MTNTQNTPTTEKQAAKHTPEAEALADAILKAAGSGLRYYTIPKTREAIFVAAQQGIVAAHTDLLEAAETALSRFAWVIDTVTRAVGHLNIDDIPQEAIALLDEVTSSEYFKDDIEQVQIAVAEATGRAA